ncbi:hypothetical protein SAMN05660909_02117 [Chitinophaga terrae (ex Kim and Jung 2007)]|uniref:Uncharacterized protein n=1 Tax=Chitinophaga terrae (ex Kim and Jung 2007) TaxID=408074 RepID=A0A1H4BK36_9BACT|nr:hypothetical protein [Chitinophaga terrae (ex Kim and Jung 2007)]GEP89609.1 hypothetical protein CTE07_12540 [Chitinophaga terrae (ex Kim and Jung 2007)]SEA48457.1 hypothetical protein SAMN05660909_02117 [Chitinophaga terrae (ex Kim and Jung 2007)]
MQITSAAVLIAVALTVFSICYYYFSTRHKERMMILEKGLPADFFSRHFTILPFLLLLGIVCIGVALGIIGGSLFCYWFPEVGTALIFLPSIAAFTGASLIIAYLVFQKKVKP